MLGTYINVGAILIGTLAGIGLGSRLKENYRELTVQAIGVSNIALGLSFFQSSTSQILIITSIGCLILGGMLGELLKIDFKINLLGHWAQTKFTSGTEDKFQQGFVSSSILFCVGPMTVLGCLEDGSGKGIHLLLLKSILDGISSAFFAAAMGWGVMLSAVSVLLVQGSLTLASGFLHNFQPNDPRIISMSVVGGLMLVALGIKLLDIKPIRVANFLPALLIVPLVVQILMHFGIL